MTTSYTEHTLRRGHSDPVGDKLAIGLGWFSIALGLTELIATRALARWMGTPQNETLLRAYGLREIGAGVGVLTAADPTPFVWARIAGDAMDIGTLLAGLNEENAQEGNVGIALANVLAVTALDVYCVHKLSGETREG